MGQDFISELAQNFILIHKAQPIKGKPTLNNDKSANKETPIDRGIEKENARQGR